MTKASFKGGLARMKRVVMFTALGLAAAMPLHAQEAPELPTLTPPNMAQSEAAPDLFLLLTLDYKPDDIAGGLAMAIRRSGRSCERVSDYQVFTRTETMRTLKVKCPGQEVYGLTIWRNGNAVIYGGDGMLRALDPDDGPVVTIYGSPLPGGAGTAKGRAPQITAAPTAVVTERPNTPIWLVIAIAANVFLLSVIGIGVLLFWRAEGAKATRTAVHVSGLTSDDKDRLTDESREVLPDIYHHPTGLFIARGRHGKRRLFRNLLFALAYRDWGLKLREIR